MHISSVITINWGNVPNGEYAFGKLHLISGETGAGKTTLADAVQTVMTAAKSGLYEYNPGQQEVTQRGRSGKIPRSLETYILGGDEGNFSRLPAAQGYVALVFEPDMGEGGKPVSAIVGAVAQISGDKKNRAAKLVSMVLFVCDGIRLSKSDFFDATVDAQHLVPLDQLYNHLKAAHGSGVHEFSDKKGQYLQKLYGAFRGRRQVSNEEANFAAGAFSRFMAYKKIDSIDEFVFDQVLDPPDRMIDIVRIIDMMREGNRLKTEAARMGEAARRLETVMTHGDAYQQAWRELRENDLALAFHRESLNAKASESGQRDIAAYREENVAAMEQRAHLRGVAANYDNQRELIKSQLNDHQDYRLRPPLLEQRQSALRRCDTSCALFGKASGDLQKTILVLEQLGQLDLSQLGVHDAVERLAPWKGERADLSSFAIASRKLSEAAEPTSDLVAACESALSAISTAIPGGGDLAYAINQIKAAATELRGQLGIQMTEVKAKIEGKHIEIDDVVKRGQLRYPKEVEDALAVIQAQVPDATPRLLCELIEVKNTAWQTAIEGYLGHNRFGIVVNEGYEALAFETLAHAQIGGGARIIQGSLARQDVARVATSPQSIVMELQCMHPIAEAYVKTQYGSVVKARGREMLTEIRRGITIDGHGTDDYTMFLCAVNDGDLVFGQHARKRRLAALQHDIVVLELVASTTGDSLAAAIQIVHLLDGFVIAYFEQHLTALHEYAEELAHIDKSLSLLDLSEAEALLAEQAALDELIAQNQEAIDEQNRRIGNIEGAIKNAQTLLTGLVEQARGFAMARKEATEVLAKLAEHDAHLDLYAAVTRAQKLATSGQALSKDIEKLRDDAVAQISPIRTGLSTAIGHYNSGIDGRAGPSERLEIDADLFNREKDLSWPLYFEIRQMLLYARHTHKRIRDTHLPDAELQIKQASHELNKAFTRDLCQIIVNDVKGGERRLTHLTGVLAAKQFGGTDTFTFEGQWQPEFKKYHDFFEEVLKLPSESPNGDLFASSTLSEAATATRDKLFKDLWSDNFEVARKKLEELGDYRNYKTYEIYKITENAEPFPLSKYGTGSGGQAETPAYLIRAAAYSSAFQFTEGGSHLRAVFLDEAFSKVDEPRTREILDYLSGDQQLQVVFIMPTKSCAAFLDTVDTHYECVKIVSDKPMGELKTRVLVQRGKYDNARVKELWETRRMEVRQQAIREFEADEADRPSL